MDDLIQELCDLKQQVENYKNEIKLINQNNIQLIEKIQRVESEKQEAISIVKRQIEKIMSEQAILNESINKKNKEIVELQFLVQEYRRRYK